MRPPFRQVWSAPYSQVVLFDPLDAASDLAFVRTVRDPGLKVVLIGMEPDGALFLQAVREGVSGYLLKMFRRMSPRRFGCDNCAVCT